MQKYRYIQRKKLQRTRMLLKTTMLFLSIALVASGINLVQRKNSEALLQRVIKMKDLEIEDLQNKLNNKTTEDVVVNDINIQPEEKIIRAKVTAYAPLDNVSGMCADSNPNVTATGTQVRRGVVAVDPKEIPYFTQVEIPGYGIASAEDTGGALRNYTEGVAIDVLVDSYEEAIEWGVQYLDVKIKQ